MADKSFGVDQLDILGTGTPTISAPNQLNLDAHTVAISTSVTVGEGMSAVNISATGISTIAQPANSNPMANWTITNNSSSAYRFTGPGQSGSDDNPDLYLVRGHRYIFKHNATTNHPIQIRVANGGAAYTDGVTYSNTGNNTTTDGNNLIINLQHDAPARLFYQCTAHGGMVGNIYTVGGPQVISGVVTATTFVGNLTGNVTGTASANAVLTGSTNNTLVTVTGANAITGEANLTFDGTNLDLGDAKKIRLGDSQDLELFHNGANSGIINSQGALYITNDATNSSDVHIRGKSSIKLHCPADGDVRILLNSSGDIGFNDTSPTAHASGNNTVLSIKGKGSSYSGKIDFKDSSGNIDSYINSDNAVLQINCDPNSQNGNTSMLFHVHGSERLRIGRHGQIGIAGANYGTSGQFLKSTGSGSAVQWASPVVAGGVLQTVQKYATNEGGTNGTSFSSWTNLAINITPLSSSSHLWIWVNAIRLLVRSDGNEGRFLITDGTNDTEQYRLTNYDSDGNYLAFNPCLNWYWTQTHTAGTQITLTPQARSTAGDWVIWGDNGDKSYIIVQEIAQ